MKQTKLIGLAVLAILILIYSFSAWVRMSHWPEGELYHSDSAFRYRYARMYATGEEIPSIDHKAQFPEGLEVRKHIHLTMQAVIGYSYRLASTVLPRVSFSHFTVYFLCFFSALTVFVVYLMARALNLRKEVGLTAAGLYGASTPAFARIVGNYLPEEFVLPFLLGAVVFFLLSMREDYSPGKRMASAIASAVLVAVSLVSWHLSQFFFALFVGFVIFTSFTFDRHRYLLKSFAIIVSGAVIVGVVSPVLRTKLFLFSIPMILSYCLLLSRWLGQKLRLVRKWQILILIAAAVLTGLVTLIFPKHYREFSHVYSLLLYKVVFLGRKPIQPDMLPYHARVFWVGPFRSPSLYHAIFDYILLIPLALYPFTKTIWRFFRRQACSRDVFFLYWVVVSGVLFLLVKRLEVFFIPFLSILAGRLMEKIRTKKGYLLVGLLVVALGFESHKAVNFQTATWFSGLLHPLRGREERFLSAYGDELSRMTQWLRGNTDASEAILARFDISGSLLAYADRPVILNPMFENLEMREKVRECWKSLYEDEEECYKTCRKYGANYLVYQAKILLDNSLDSDRYTMNELEVDPRSAIHRFHFEPDSLRYFNLVYQSTSFRVYAVGKDVEESLTPVPYSVLFDEKLLLKDGKVDDEKTNIVIDRLKRATLRFNRAATYVNRGQLDEAIKEFQIALELAPDLEKTHAGLGQCYWRKGDFDGSIRNYLKAVDVDPWDTQSRHSLAVLYAHLGRFEDALREFTAILRTNPKDVEALIGVGKIYGMKGELALAEKQLKLAIQYESGNAEAHFGLGMVNLSKGDANGAVREFKKAVELDHRFMEMVKQVMGDDFLRR